MAKRAAAVPGTSRDEPTPGTAEFKSPLAHRFFVA
jgi:hypothetical protein